jgi:hypothetical protein
MIVVYFRRDGLTGFGIAAAAFLVAGALVAALIFRFITCYQCCRSMTFWCGSGFGIHACD